MAPASTRSMCCIRPRSAGSPGAASGVHRDVQYSRSARVGGLGADDPLGHRDQVAHARHQRRHAAIGSAGRTNAVAAMRSRSEVAHRDHRSITSMFVRSRERPARHGAHDVEPEQPCGRSQQKPHGP